MAKTKEISRRIKSVANTRKITKAMEMVAAAKMKKAVAAVLRTRSYSQLSWETVLHLAQSSNAADYRHPLLVPHQEIKRIAIVLITSNRGMCGAYNSSIINQARRLATKIGVETDFILAGSKGEIVKRLGSNVSADFAKSDLVKSSKDIYPIAKLIIDSYQSGTYDKIFVAYTDFVNAVVQKPRVKQLLPVETETTPEQYLGVIGDDPQISLSNRQAEKVEDKYLHQNNFSYEYLFEPDPASVLDRMIPRLIEVQLFQAFLEANASEHAARMTAMNQATEAADDMIKELTLFYNKARQAGITAEIAEISAGANALAE